MKRFGVNVLRAATAALIAMSLVACGRGSHSAMLPATTGGGAASLYTGPLSNATFTITIPAPPKGTSTTRRPQYISAATRSIRVNMTTSSRIASPGSQFNVVTNVTNSSGSSPGSPCTGSGPWTCTLSIQVPPGSDTFTFTAYDNAAGTGNILSQQVQTLTLVTGVANAFNVTFDANASAISITGTQACSVGTVANNGAFGTVGTSPVTFDVAFADAASKTIVAPGRPKIQIQDNTGTWQSSSGTINGSGGTVSFTINQSAQTFTLSPSSTSVTNAVVNVKGIPANTTGSGDGLSFSTTSSFTFSTGAAPPPHDFLAAVEQTGTNTGRIDFYNIGLDGSSNPVSFGAYNPSSLAVTTSSNDPTQKDVDNPVSLGWDNNGDVLIGNGGSSGTAGNFACVPAGAISTGANLATTITTNVHNPVSLAYEPRNGTVAIGNNYASPVLAEFVLSGDYAASANNYTGSGLHSGTSTVGQSVVNIPSQAAGTFAFTASDGCEVDAANRGTCSGNGTSELVVFGPSGPITTVTGSSPNYYLDEPVGIAWDSTNGQLIVPNQAGYHPSVSFFNVSGTYEKSISTYFANSQTPFMVAASGDGHFAVAYSTAYSANQVQIYTNGSGTTAPTAVDGPIAFNATTDSTCSSTPSTYPYGASAVVTAMTWLSNTRLLVAVTSLNGSSVAVTGTANGKSVGNGLYIFDASTPTTMPTGLYDDQYCTQLGTEPTQDAFQPFSYKPLAAAYKP